MKEISIFRVLNYGAIGTLIAMEMIKVIGLEGNSIIPVELKAASTKVATESNIRKIRISLKFMYVVTLTLKACK